jgi:predicted nucleic acid-binding protein
MPEAKAFLDTNILLYLLSPDATKADRAEALVDRGGVISVQVLNEFASVATRKLSMQLPDIREILSTVRTLCDVVPLSLETHDLGLDLAERYHLSIFDALIVATARLAKCRTLYSEDMQHGQKIDGLTILNPFRAGD